MKRLFLVSSRDLIQEVAMGKMCGQTAKSLNQLYVNSPALCGAHPRRRFKGSELNQMNQSESDWDV